MRIGIVTYDYDPPIGGLGIHVKRLLGAMRKETEAHNFIILSPSSNAQPFVSPFVRQRWKRKGGAPLFSLWLFLALGRFVRKQEVDLVHLQAGSGGVFLLKKSTVPVIATVHHTFLEEAAAYKSKPITYVRKLLMCIPEKRTYKLCDYLMAVSKDIKQTLVRSYSVPEEKIMVVENSIDLEKFSDDSGEREVLHLLFVGRVEPRKGIAVLLHATAIVRKTYPTIRLTIAGDNLMGQSLFTMLRRHNIDDITEVRGFVPADAYMHLLATATLLVVPSIAEGFGLTAAEGMAAGIPVIASDCVGLKSLITHERTGLLFETDDADACAQAILRALSHQEERKRWATAARRAAFERFSPRRQALSTLACYERLVSGK